MHPVIIDQPLYHLILCYSEIPADPLRAQTQPDVIPWTLVVESNWNRLYLFWLQWEFPLVWTCNTHGLAIRQLLQSHDSLCRRIKLRCCSSCSPSNVFPVSTPHGVWHAPPDSTLRQPRLSLLDSPWHIVFCILNLQVILITYRYMIWYDIFVNCNWVVTRWQQYTFTHKQYIERYKTNNT